MEGEDSEKFGCLSRRQPNAYLHATRVLAEWGQYEKAVIILERCAQPSTLLRYYLAYYLHQCGREDGAKTALTEAASASPLHCFPNHLDDIAPLQYAMAANPKDAKAPYYLANLWYDKRQYEDAIILWETSAKLEGSYPTVWRNLSLAYFNKRNDPKSALDALERAFQLDTTDARVLLELDQLYQKLGKARIERRAFLEKHLDICQLRDDLYIEYITLLNLLGDHQGAIGRAAGRQFHPWEGGEGKITGQYMHALWMLARQAMVAGDYLTAKAQLKAALHFPPNLGEGKLEGATDNNLHYELGKVYDALGQKEKAQEHYRKACRGHFDLSATISTAATFPALVK